MTISNLWYAKCIEGGSRIGAGATPGGRKGKRDETDVGKPSSRGELETSAFAAAAFSLGVGQTASHGALTCARRLERTTG